MTALTKILEFDRVTKNFGGLRAIDDLSFSIEKGKVTALIGPNGAGKTTTHLRTQQRKYLLRRPEPAGLVGA